MNELGIYIHIPFCKSKCYYCDFISYSNKESEMPLYFSMLLKEINIKSKKIKKEDVVTTIYIGGGTPSFVSEKYIRNILNEIKKDYNVDENAEVTIEINPGAANREKLQSYNNAGINRISIGLQTTENKILKQISRIHTYEEFLECYNNARKVEFKNINVDLMLALPNQTLENLQQSLRKVIELNPEHISLYSLILEENTRLEKMVENKEIKLPSEDIERQMYWKTKEILEQNGYKHYEISNFAKKGYESKHNTNCWKQKEYLGFGVAAHSYYNNQRYCNTNNIEQYCKNIEQNKLNANVTICEIQAEEEKKKEYMILGLRMIDGINIKEFKNKFVDNPVYIFRNELQKLSKDGLIEIDLNQIKLTNKGLDFANLVWEEFV